MAFIAVYDACVLYPSVTRDVLIRVAIAGTVQARWTDDILDEVRRNVAADRPDISRDQLSRLFELMAEALPSAAVGNHHPLIDGLELPEPDDRHVLAAAIASGAQLIVTDNLRDFPPAVLDTWNIEAKRADDLLVDQFHLAPDVLHGVVHQLSRAWKGEPTPSEVLRRFESSGLLQTAALLR
ncbi:PIN domain-containing protein [Nakamurella flava]|uniref:PIN domain-containing protein n=1 Tax=Nakamurella flava TaxID=2576308 RepID=A0A4U6QA78_9ACTN|nr:PIN domain-containing protein [Nakamurella flava]TKV56792.1 PIN domain-containing protein [Nakamurella flava]